MARPKPRNVRARGREGASPILPAGIFRSLLFQANDFSAFMGYQYRNGAGLVVQPSFMTSYRVADLVSQDRFLFTLKTDFLQSLTKDLSLILTPKLKYFVFTSGTAAGKRETLPSISGGLTYNINADLSVTTSVEYDRRWSNRAGNDYKDLILLVSLDFGHIYNTRLSK